METLTQYFNNIRKVQTNRTLLCISILCLCAGISIVSTIKSYQFAKNSRDLVYVLDGGSAFSAKILSNETEVLTSELTGQVERFHELMFNLTPSTELIKTNLEKALGLSDRSAYDYYSDLSESGFYQRLVSADISQQIAIDSIKIESGVYPYKIRTYAKLYLLRQDSITSYDFESSCQSIRTRRTPSNPHGLTLEKFQVLKSTKLDSRQRE